MEDDFTSEEYYRNLARRVYLLADLEGWSSKQTMKMLSDKVAFEKYYSAVSGYQSCLIVIILFSGTSGSTR